MESLIKCMDIAKALSISRAYAYRLVMDGTIPAKEDGRDSDRAKRFNCPGWSGAKNYR